MVNRWDGHVMLLSVLTAAISLISRPITRIDRDSYREIKYHLCVSADEELLFNIFERRMEASHLLMEEAI